MLKPLREAMPDYSDYLEAHGLSVVNHLIEPLEERLLAALMRSLDGEGADAEALARSARVLHAAEAALSKSSKTPAVPAV